jgi:CheY-like chemotaxis protein/anti-sigma regulatory factor (Ser/Thr protein kinase)
MESIGTLAGGIAHDFNNILASIIGFTELALDEVQKGTSLDEHLQEVYTAGNRAKELVKQILAFARQSEGQRNPIQPSIIVKEVLKFIRSTIPATIAIRQDIESDTWIMGDATQIHQVIMNLCTNAAQAMEDTGGVLKVSLKDVVIDQTHAFIRMGLRKGNYIEIAVSDTGVGIAPDIIGSIFEPYFTTKGPSEGSGLGLAMVHGIVESYGGKITVDSNLKKGTTFTIFLPVTAKGSTRGSYKSELLPTGTERILFVDDESAIAKMSGVLLEHLGYSVTTRTSSMEALELFRAKPNAFDLVITDMTMPNMTGASLGRRIADIVPALPLIICTGCSQGINEEKARALGFKKMLLKPVCTRDLALAVRETLDGRATG